MIKECVRIGLFWQAQGGMVRGMGRDTVAEGHSRLVGAGAVKALWLSPSPLHQSVVGWWWELGSSIQS